MNAQIDEKWLPCPCCRGDGHERQELCDRCQGSGYLTAEQEVHELVEALEAIFEHYPNPEMNHVDYRVFAARTAEKALDRHKMLTGFL